MRHGYMLLRRNAFVGSELPGSGYLVDKTAGGKSAYPEAFRQCMVDYNRVSGAQGAVLINNEGGEKKYTSLEDIRKDLGWELHGQVLPYQKDTTTPQAAAQAMGGGVMTFRIPWGKYRRGNAPHAQRSHNRRRLAGSAVSGRRLSATVLLALRRRELQSAPVGLLVIHRTPSILVRREWARSQGEQGLSLVC